MMGIQENVGAGAKLVVSSMNKFTPQGYLCDQSTQPASGSRISFLHKEQTCSLGRCRKLTNAHISQYVGVFRMRLDIDHAHRKMEEKKQHLVGGYLDAVVSAQLI